MTAVFSRLALDYLGFGSLYVNNSTSTHFPLLLQNVVVLFQRRFCVNAFSHVLPPSPLFTFRELQIQACVASFVVSFVFQVVVICIQPATRRIHIVAVHLSRGDELLCAYPSPRGARQSCGRTGSARRPRPPWRISRCGNRNYSRVCRWAGGWVSVCVCGGR